MNNVEIKILSVENLVVCRDIKCGRVAVFTRTEEKLLDFKA